MSNQQIERKCTNIETFLIEAFDFFEKNCEVTGSNYLSKLHDNLFVCVFLYDCISKGIELHEEQLKERIDELSRKISPEEVPRIKNDFSKLIEGRELVTIPAYEFFLNYLVDIILYMTKINHNLLKSVGKVEYKAPELVEKVLKDPNKIIVDLQNLFIYGTKQRGNLKTDPSFWLKILRERMKIEIPNNCITFWHVFHERRNAASHIEARDRWNALKTELKYTDMILWIYGLLYTAYNIDSKFHTKYEIPVEKIKINLTGEPLYKIRFRVKVSHMLKSKG